MSCFVLGVGAVMLIGLIGCDKSGFKYSKYSNSSPIFGINIDYIKDWKWMEHVYKEEKYASVIFVPQNRKILGESAGINIYEAPNLSVEPRTLEALANDLVVKKSHYDEAKVIKRSVIKLLGVQAIDIEMSFKIPENIRVFNAKLIPVKARYVLLNKGEKFYVLKFMAGESDFAKNAKAYEHIAKSLRVSK